MGDHEDGLAYLIIGVAAVMLLGALTLALLLGRALARALGWDRRGQGIAGLVGSAIGLGLGTLLVIATFFGSTWAPPPVLAFTVPRGFAQRWVVLLEDPAAPAIAWHGVELPFHGKSAALTVPPSGVLRVRSLDHLAGRGDTDVRWSDGAAAVGFASVPVPRGVRATGIAAYERQPIGASFPTDSLPEGAALAAYLRARGG